MKKLTMLALAAAALTAATASRLEAADPPQFLQRTPATLDPKLAADLRKSDLVLADSNAARDLIAGTIGNTAEYNRPDFYCAIHVVSWVQKKSQKDGVTRYDQKVDGERWYLYRGGAENFVSVGFSDRTRLYSGSRFYVLWVDLGFSQDVQAEPTYKVEVKAKPVTNAGHLLAFIKEFSSVERDAVEPPAPKQGDYFGFGQIDMRGARAADVSITPQLRTGGKDAANGDAKVYDFEPLERWDIGIGVPIHRASQVSLDADKQTLAPKAVDRNTVLVLFSLYPTPIDLRGNGLMSVPHLVLGLDATEKFDARRRFVVGLGWGPALANFYVGGELVKLDQPSPSGKVREWQWAFGVALSGIGTLKAAAK